MTGDRPKWGHERDTFRFTQPVVVIWISPPEMSTEAASTGTLETKSDHYLPGEKIGYWESGGVGLRTMILRRLEMGVHCEERPSLGNIVTTCDSGNLGKVSVFISLIHILSFQRLLLFRGDSLKVSVHISL